MEIALSSIRPGKNPRHFFDPAEMAELESSIRANGILQPILVRPVGDSTYEIVAGERRFRAARAVYGETGTIPAVVREMSDDEADAAALVENTLRANMSAGEEAEAAYALVTRFKGDRAEVAAQLGWPQSKLSRRLALMEATQAVREALANRMISLGHAELLAAAPKDKQDKVLSRVIADNIPVSTLKSQLAAISQSLDAAIFDKTECGACPHNSSIQSQMFAEVIVGGHCTNPACFNAKTESRIEAIVAEQRENFPRVEILRAGSAIETIPVVAKGRVGVGEEQMEACKGCGNHGATVSAMPGSEGRVEPGVCFDATCHVEKVASYLKTLAPETEKTVVGKSGTGKPAATKPKAAANQAATPQRLKDYRVKVWKTALAAEIEKDAFVAGTALIAMVLSGNAHHIMRSHTGIEVKGNGIGEFYASLQGLSGSDVSKLVARIPLGAVNGLHEADVCRLLSAMDCNLAEHWVMDAEFLDLLTKSEIEALAVETGIAAAMGEAFKKALTGKKAEIIDRLLKVEGFTYRGAVPACMQYAGAKPKKTKPAKTTETSPAPQETCPA